MNININLGPKEVEENIKNKNFGFMFAPAYHSAMKYVGPIRKKIGNCDPYIIASFHPAFLMRQPDQKKLAWIDLKLIKEKMKQLNF